MIHCTLLARNKRLPLSLQIVPASAIPDGWMGLDIGPDSIKTFNDALETTKTVIWNGPMGVFEFDKFATGTEVCEKFCGYFFIGKLHMHPVHLEHKTLPST